MSEKSKIKIHIANLVGGKYWVATSPDVPGFYISGTTREDVVARIDDELELLVRLKQLDSANL